MRKRSIDRYFLSLYFRSLCFEQALRYEKCTRLDIIPECIWGLVIVERRQQTDRKPHNWVETLQRIEIRIDTRHAAIECCLSVEIQDRQLFD